MKLRNYMMIILSCGIIGCTKPESPSAGPVPIPKQPLNVVMIVIDTLRADHVSSYGYPRPVSPVMDRLALRGIEYVNAVCTSPITNPSHASFFTGLYPWQHGCRSNYYVLSSEIRTLAEHFKSRGYSTGAFVSGSPLKPEVSRFDQGFDIYNADLDTSVYKPTFTIMANTGDIPKPDAQGKKPRHTALRSVVDYQRRDGRKTLDKAKSWLDTVQGPWFLFLHLYDVHGPYEARFPMAEFLKSDIWQTQKTSLDGVWIPDYQKSPGDTRADYVRRYDSNIYYVDRLIEELIYSLGSKGLLNTTFIQVTSDHGESLGENQYGFDHGLNLYNESIHLPSFMVFPGIIPAGKLEESILSGIDWPVTMWYWAFREDFVSQERFAMPGRVVGFGKPGPKNVFWRFCETKPHHTEEPTNRYYACMNESQKYIYRYEESLQEFYDLNADPDEIDSSAMKPQAKTVVETMRTMVEREIIHGDSTQIFLPGGEVPESEKKALQSLGYTE